MKFIDYHRLPRSPEIAENSFDVELKELARLLLWCFVMSFCAITPMSLCGMSGSPFEIIYIIIIILAAAAVPLAGICLLRLLITFKFTPG